ncbi:MAG: SMI1/KNR4 family protein [Pirellulaceae bacterium]
MPLLDLKGPTQVTNKCYFRLKRNDYGAKIRYTLKSTCEQIWISLLPHLRPGEPWGDLVIWRAGTMVEVRPASSDVDETHPGFARCHPLSFEVRDYRDERRKLEKQTEEEAPAAVRRLEDEFHMRLRSAIVESFKLKSVQESYREYNPDGRPFSILLTRDDQGLSASEFSVLWRNKTGLTAPKLANKNDSVRGRPLPKEERAPSRVERGREQWKAKKKKEQTRQRKSRAVKKREQQQERDRKKAMQAPATSERLTPDIRFRSGTIVARCKKAWLQLFALLYEYGTSAEAADAMLWELSAEKAVVRLSPRSTDVDESAPGLRQRPEFHFQIDGLAQELKGANGAGRKAERARIRQEFNTWAGSAIVEAFHTEPVQVEYSWFNEHGHPFSVFSTPADQGLHGSDLSLLLSECGGLDAEQVVEKQKCLQNGKEFKAGRKHAATAKPKKAKPKKVKPKTAKRNLAKPPAPPTFGPTWRRFYFDDGATRRFWYLETKGGAQRILEGDLGAVGKESHEKFDSPGQAREASRRLVEKRLEQGFVEYAAKEITYVRKHRLAKKLVTAAVMDFEQEFGAPIPYEYRRYLLSVNGGHPEQNWITLPGHRRKKVEIGTILGFKVGQTVWEVPYNHRAMKLPQGHIPMAEGKHLFSLDALGAVHFWDLEQLERSDWDDDGVVHFDRQESFLAASSFEEFLTRLATFPHDTKVKVNVEHPAARQQAAAKRFAHARQAAEKKPLRRFFLDDGRSRKFWRIHTTGNSQTVHYGRLGSAGTKATKTFRSPGEAAASTAKLIRQKTQNGYQEVLPEMLSIERPRGRRPATAAAIGALEKQIGASLPPEYRRFLETQNGGRPEPEFIEIPGVRHISNVDAGFLYGLYPREIPGESLSWGLKTHAPVLPPGHLPVAYGADIFTLSFDRRPGCVFFWDHESNEIDDDERFLPSAGHLLAGSFDEYLTRIAAFPGEPTTA